MEETLLKTCDNPSTCGQSANWYRATTLTERIALLRGNANDQPPGTLPNREMALQKLKLWKEQTPFNKGSYFAQRLAMDSLTEDDLLSILAEPMEAVQACFSTPPVWLSELLSAFTDQNTADDFILSTQNAEDSPALAFLNTLKPLLKRGVSRLHAGVQELIRKYDHLPFDPRTIITLLFARVPDLFIPKIGKTIILELNVARVQGLLQGETPQERFQYFLRHLAQLEGMLPILEEYTVLARQLVETIDRWVSCELEFLERLCSDWEQIRTTFVPDSDPGVLTAVHEGAGDTHRGGRSVITLTWSSGFRLVYKPRSLAVDNHFQELLTWLNTRGYQPAFRTFKLIDKGAYGWCEFVHAQGCTSPEEIERFYQRQGGYLALLYALDGSDFHSENLIAAGEHPVLIDLEALFYPRVRVPDAAQQKASAAETMRHSVLRTGLLPLRAWSNDDAADTEMSGLGGQARQLTPVALPIWKEGGTDQMQIARERIDLVPGNHRPKLNDHDIDTLTYSNSIITGFATAYRLLIQHREELLTTILPRFAHDQIRSMLRPSQQYGLLQVDSFHPNALRDALARERLFDRLWVGVEHMPHLARLIPAERADLLRGDIPLFTTYPDSCDLFTSQGEKIPEFFSECGMDLVRQRIQQLDEQDLEKQIWVIRTSFASLALGTEMMSRYMLQLQPSQSRLTSERLISGARAMGERLHKLALYSDDAVGWLGVVAANGRRWYLEPVGVDLYNGLPGITFFLAYLGMLTGEERYTTLARLSLRATRYKILPGGEYARWGGVGVFEGIGSFIYLLSHLGSLWNDPTLYQEAEETIKQLPALIANDKMFDVMSGSAGCIGALLSLYAVAPSASTLMTAIQCGEHLLANARLMSEGIAWSSGPEVVPLTGMAHGNAGIALSLLRLFGASGEERFREAALAAMQYERSLFSAEKQNWPDLRNWQARTVNSTQTAGEEHRAFMVAWCYGAPGIGLARLASLEYIDDAAIRAEIDAALQTTLTEGFSMNHSLCHGDMGNMEMLLTMIRLLNNTGYCEPLERLACMLLDSIDTQGWCCGIPSGVETPGLMLGLSGIGYALLRLAAPERVPSVLTFAAPCR